MTTVATIAEKSPEAIAVIYGDREHVETYAELEQRSRRIGHLLRRMGIEPGDSIAALIGNDDDFFDVFWAAHRTGKRQGFPRLAIRPVAVSDDRAEVRELADALTSDLGIYLGAIRW